MVIILLGGKPPPSAEVLERDLCQMEDVLRELRNETCPHCRRMHYARGPELEELEVWLRAGCARAAEAIEVLTSCIAYSAWENEGYASLEAVHDHIARLGRLKCWNEDQILDLEATTVP